MKKRILILLLVIILALTVSGAALAHAPEPGCSGLDQAHDQIHASDTQGEHVLHHLRDAMGCTH
ncbi:MAG: hypothetical protein R3300_01015 [Candidatus Promineifilaceae bacterium]|nr:hypothetical protein [Candidatus Promineifilaceae bacterium]